MGATLTRKPAYRSLFWPIVLIGAGVIWLLANFNIVSAENLAVLFRLWPLILIVVGLDLLFGRRSTVVGGLLGIGTVVLVVVLMLVGPSIGLGAPDLNIITENFNTTLEDTSSANINLSTSVGRVTVDTLSDSNDLLQAEVAHIGTIEFEKDGQTVSLRQQDENLSFGLDWVPRFLSADTDLYWNVNLNPNVPIALNIDSGVGDGVYNLSDLLLLGVDASLGVGNVTLNLPAMPDAYDVNLNGGSGTTSITLADDSAVKLFVNGGVGSVTIDVPDNAAVRIEANSGVGGVELPGNFVRVSGDNESNFVGAEGVWETTNFAGADRRINIDYSGGVGALTVR